MATIAIAAAIGGAVAVGSYLLMSNRNTTVENEGSRLSSSRLTTSTEGASMSELYGRQRLNGQIIWATQFKETKNVETTKTKSGGKGGGGSSTTTKTTTYTYSISLAIAFCKGSPKASISRMWADGDEIDMSLLDFVFYPGDDTQEPDPTIEEVQGAGNVPAYRGTAYVVIKDMQLADYGNRVPQITAEIVVPLETDDEVDMQNSAEAYCLIPASGEHIYDPQQVNVFTGEKTTKPDNVHNAFREPDVVRGMKNLTRMQDNLQSVLLVVAWFGDDLRAGSCTIEPRHEGASRYTSLTQSKDGREWSVMGFDRTHWPAVSTDGEGRPIYGGTPSDDGLKRLIAHLRDDLGLRVVFYPFVLMDVPADNTLPNPYSDNAAEVGQAAFPWRGRITCSPAPGYVGTADKTAAAKTQIDAWYDQYDVMVEHYAQLCADAGGVAGFVIGSELVGLNKSRDALGSYPSVDRLVSLAASVKSTVGSGTDVTYAADWSEWYHSSADGHWFHLDPLWSSPNIDACGIDNYLPLSDWRDGTQHLDYDGVNGPVSPYEPDYLRSNIEGGEYFDWYYQSYADRVTQTRTDITDGAHNKPWVFRNKDFRSWWQNEHYNRPGFVEDATPTNWVPGSKPIWFTEFGFPAVDKGTNQPNVFYDPKSSESAYPYFSSGLRDDFIQRVATETVLDHWRNNSPVYPSTAAASLTIPPGDYGSSLPSRNADVVMSGVVTLPSSPTDCVIMEFGGSGAGLALVVRDGGTVLRLRSGSGSVTAPATNCAILDLSVADLPFDDQPHALAWDVDASTGTIRLWVDGELKGEASTIGNTALAIWAGTGWGIWLTGAGVGTNITGEPTAVSNYDGSDLSIWSSTKHNEVKMLEPRNMFIWTWDARPFPDWPARDTVWSDGGLWFKGHWFTGRLESVPLARLVAALCAKAGLTPDQYDVTGLYGPGALVRGYEIDKVGKVRTQLETLMEAYLFDAFESEGKIKFLLRSGTRTSSVSEDDIVITDGDPVGVNLTRGQETELPSSVKVTFIDEFNDYNSGSVDGKTARGYSQNVQEIELPMLLTTDYCRSLADGLVQQRWVERQTGELRLPPSLTKFDPGDAVSFPVGSHSITGRFTVMSFGEAREIEYAAFDPGIFSLPLSPDDERLPGLANIYGGVDVVFLDLPLFTGEEELPWAPRFVANASPWPGSVSLYKQLADDTYEFVNFQEIRNAVGELASPLQAGPVGRWDKGTVLHVAFDYGAISSVSEAIALNSALAIGVYNAAVNEWEVIQFTTATPQPDGTYYITNLLRGQLGTETAITGTDLPTGAQVVLLEPDTLATVVLTDEQSNNEIQYLFGPSRYPNTDDTYKLATHTGTRAGLRPYSPTDLQLAANAAGDLTVTWKRRTRFNGDNWDVAEPPLNEEVERYRLRIYDGMTVVREIETTSPTYTYSAADQTSDFGSGQSSLKVDAAQFGSGYGDYGAVREATLTIGKATP